MQLNRKLTKDAMRQNRIEAKRSRGNFTTSCCDSEVVRSREDRGECGTLCGPDENDNLRGRNDDERRIRRIRNMVTCWMREASLGYAHAYAFRDLF